jgi:hypothetical protein
MPNGIIPYAVAPPEPPTPTLSGGPDIFDTTRTLMSSPGLPAWSLFVGVVGALLWWLCRPTPATDTGTHRRPAGDNGLRLVAVLAMLVAGAGLVEGARYHPGEVAALVGSVAMLATAVLLLRAGQGAWYPVRDTGRGVLTWLWRDQGGPDRWRWGWLAWLDWCRPARWHRVARLAVLLLASPAIAAFVLVAATLRGTWWAWRWRREVHVPLYASVAKLLAYPPDAGRKWVKARYWDILPDTGGTLRIRLPRTYGASGTDVADTALSKLINRRIPGDWEAHYQLCRYPFAVTFTHAPSPPRFVPFEQVRHAAMSGPDSRPVLGLDMRGEIVRGDLDQEAPHWLFSMKTGAGKSSLLRWLIAQWVRKGVRVTIIDPKRKSQNWAKGLPGVTIVRDVENWFTVVAEFHARMEERYRIADNDDDAVFPREVLVIEELNTFTEKCKIHWKKVKEKGDPTEPPVLTDLTMCLFEGREAMMHVVAVSQRADSNATGGPAARENYGLIGLAQWSPQVWRMLVNTSPRPIPSTNRGRILYVLGGKQTNVQTPYITKEEARAFALSGNQAPAPTVPPSHGPTDGVTLGSVGVTVTVPPGRPHLRVVNTGAEVATVRTEILSGNAPENGAESDPKTTYPPPRPEDRQPRYYTLREAATGEGGQGIVPESYDVLRKQRSVDPEFPAGVEVNGRKRYTADELKYWSRNRAHRKTS